MSTAATPVASDSIEVNRAIRGKARSSAWWAEVSEVARTQEGVIAHEQLRAIGFSDDQISRLVQSGQLIRLHRGVYAVGHRCLSTKAYLIAALLACGSESFLSRGTAKAVYGLRDVSTKHIDVTIPNCRRSSRGSLKIHTTTAPVDVKVRNGLRVSSFPQMLIELAGIESRQELERLVTWGIRKGLLDLDELREALARHPRRRGLAKLKATLAGYLPTHDRKSDLERDFDAFLLQHPEIPEPRRNIYIDGWEVDCYWPEFKLAVELDGRPYHIAVRDIEKDKVRDGKLLLRGVRTLRITDMRFKYDREGVYDDLVSLTRS